MKAKPVNVVTFPGHWQKPKESEWVRRVTYSVMDARLPALSSLDLKALVFVTLIIVMGLSLAL